MKRFAKVVLSLAVVLAALSVVIAMQPAEMRVERSLTINAPADKVFSYVNNLHKWNEWSPWARLDPDAAYAFSGVEEGVGAMMSWDGNFEVGKGSMTIIRSDPGEALQFQLAFEKPMRSTSVAEFTFKPMEDKTLVTWSMHGEKNFIAKAMGLIFNCEKMVGEQFNEGLENLDAVVNDASDTELQENAG